MRMRNWNYNSRATYFITICVAGRLPRFGRIVDGQMLENALGTAVRSEWLKTPFVRQDMNLFLGEFVVMPDHFHAILEIGGNVYNKASASEYLLKWRDDRIDEADNFGPQRKNLASVIRGFKASVSHLAKAQNIDFKWQARYHEIRIRNRKQRKYMEDYIRDNPALWETEAGSFKEK